MKPIHCWLIAMVVAGVACGQSDAGTGTPGPDTVITVEDSLTFLRPAPNAPGFGNLSVSFWAVKGIRSQVELRYRALPGQSDSAVFVRFRVDPQSLRARPDGTPIADGDSVLITLSVDDSTRLICKYEPEGLQFDSKKPARLFIKYGEADPDLDRNGVVNAQDTALVRSFRIWRQEVAGEPWVGIPSTVAEDALEVQADIYGFTRYAVAY